MDDTSRVRRKNGTNVRPYISTIIKEFDFLLEICQLATSLISFATTMLVLDMAASSCHWISSCREPRTVKPLLFYISAPTILNIFRGASVQGNTRITSINDSSLDLIIGVTQVEERVAPQSKD